MSPFRYVIFISILLSQKIGTGKTTKIRSLLSSVNDNPNNASYQEPLRPIIIKNQVSLRIAVGNDLTSTCNKNLMNNASVINDGQSMLYSLLQKINSIGMIMKSIKNHMHCLRQHFMENIG
eukprot:529506_1